MANTKVTGDLIASSTIATDNIADNAVTSDKISGITTAHIAEGTNLYYTDARADARITAATTSDLSEGTNLYYTDARARSAVSVSGNALSYDSSTGVITSNFEESPTFTGGITATYGNYSSGVNAEYFRTAAANTNYNLITRDSTGNALFVQNSQSNANQPIANFRYGSSSVNQGTAVLQVSKDNSHFVNCNVGIGTASPAAKLSVVGSGENGGIFFNNSGAQEHRFYSSANSQFNTIGSSSPIWHWAQYTGVGVAPNYKMTLNSTGLGIGTTSPESGAKLDVRAGSGGKIVLGSYDANYKIVVEGGDQLNFYNGTSATTAYINYGATGTPGNVLVSRNLFVEANSSGGVNGTIRIKSDGKVGINTTTPAFKTHIRGGSGTEETVLKIDKSSAADSGGHTTIVGLGVESAGWAKAGIAFERTGAYDTGKMHFLMYPTGLNTNTVGLSNSVMTINNDGNVGIGTADPDHKLEVVGGLALRNSNSRLYFGTNNGTDRRALEGSVDGALLQVGESYNNTRIYGVAQVMGATLAVGDSTAFNTYQGISAYGSNPSLALRASGSSSWCWTEYRTNGNTNNFSMGVNQTVPYWGVKNGAGLDNPVLKVKNVGGVTQTDKHENGLYSDSNQPPAVYLGKSGNVMGTGGIYRLGSVVSSSTTNATNIPVVTTYSSGHWGAQPTFFLEFVVTYYRSSYVKYWCQHTVSGTTIEPMHGPFGGQMTSSPLTVTVTQLCTNCNGGQPVYKAVWKWTNYGTYLRTTPTISIQYGAGSTRIYTDGTSTESLIDTLHGGSGSPGAGILLHGINDAQAAGGDIITYN